MSDQLANYSGREQSYIKHLFLTEYLRSAAYKILQARSSVFNYVDAFAGPWQLAGENQFSDASFHQAVQTLDEVRNDLQNRGLDGLRICSFFCEKRPDAAAELQAYARRHEDLRIQVFEGAFEQNLDAIAAACREGFTFTFIDPTGWNIRSERVFRFLAGLGGEFLFNFMAEPINRHAGYRGVTASMGRFLADPDWENDFNALPEDWTNEACVLHLLKGKMKEMKVATFLPEIAIKRPKEERIKMRLLLGTHSGKGVEVFRDVQRKVEKREMEIRTRLRLGGPQRGLLFSDNQLAAIQQAKEGVGCRPNLQGAEVFTKDLLRERGSMSFKYLAPRVLESVPVHMTDLKKLLRRLKDSGVVGFTPPSGKRNPQPATLITLV